MERPSETSHSRCSSVLLLVYDTTNKGADWAKNMGLLAAILSLSFISALTFMIYFHFVSRYLNFLFDFCSDPLAV